MKIFSIFTIIAGVLSQGLNVPDAQDLIDAGQNIANQVADAVGDVDTGAILDNFVDGLDEAKDGALELINGFTENSEGKAAASCALTAVLFYIQ